MLLSKKTKGFFIEVNDHSVLAARTTSPAAPLVIEELRSCGVADDKALAEILAELQGKRTGQKSYMHATCGIYTPKRIIRRAALDSKRFKDPGYLNEVLVAQARVEPDKYTMSALTAKTGVDFDLNDPTQKESLFAGMLTEEVTAVQKKLLSRGIYPERLEMGTVATLGALTDYLAFTQSKAPTLVLEIDGDSTNSFILSESGVDTARPISQGLDAIVPVVQKELGLKDEESARKLFFSNTFDFTGMGATLIKKLLKELQSSIGFYEVQTGQSIGQVICTLLPSKLSWLEGAIASQLGVTLLKIDYVPWLKQRGITFSGPAASKEIDTRWLGLISLMIKHNHAVAS